MQNVCINTFCDMNLSPPIWSAWVLSRYNVDGFSQWQAPGTLAHALDVMLKNPDEPQISYTSLGLNWETKRHVLESWPRLQFF